MRAVVKGIWTTADGWNRAVAGEPTTKIDPPARPLNRSITNNERREACQPSLAYGFPMTHPARFVDDDPYLARLRQICLALPQAAEKLSHGRPVFYTKKIFALFGGVVLGDHASDDYGQAVVVLPDADEREALLADERFFHPAYYGPMGWIGLNFRVGAPDWDEVAELVDTSYRNTAVKYLVAELDGRSC